jgi:hypothetical protein
MADGARAACGAARCRTAPRPHFVIVSRDQGGTVPSTTFGRTPPSIAAERGWELGRGAL